MISNFNLCSYDPKKFDAKWSKGLKTGIKQRILNDGTKESKYHLAFENLSPCLLFHDRKS